MGDGSTSGDPTRAVGGVDIKFSTDTDDSHSFSIRCGKCADIHNAQIDGKTNKPCECDCHGKYQQPYVPFVPYIPYCPPDPCCPQIPPYYTTTTGTDGRVYTTSYTTPYDGETTCDCREHPKGGMTGEECYKSQNKVYGLFDYHLAGIIDG